MLDQHCICGCALLEVEPESVGAELGQALAERFSRDPLRLAHAARLAVALDWDLEAGSMLFIAPRGGDRLGVVTGPVNDHWQRQAWLLAVAVGLQLLRFGPAASYGGGAPDGEWDRNVSSAAEEFASAFIGGRPADVPAQRKAGAISALWSAAAQFLDLDLRPDDELAPRELRQRRVLAMKDVYLMGLVGSSLIARLWEAGYRDSHAVAAAEDAQLLAIPGLGPARLRALRTHLESNKGRAS